MALNRSHAYTVVDVFTTEPLAGNALAVFPDASGFDAVTMQRIARELNLAETAFIIPATRKDCVARVRIFTPATELAIRGTSTVGTAFVLVLKGIIASDSTEFMLEEGVGPVQIRVEGGRPPFIWLRTPPIHEGRYFDRALCARTLGLEPEDLLPLKPQLLSTGNPTLLIAVKEKAAVDRASLDLTGLKVLKGGVNEVFCVFLFATTPDGAYSRMFDPNYGVPEDPATGSSTGPLAVYMIRERSAIEPGEHAFLSANREQKWAAVAFYTSNYAGKTGLTESTSEVMSHRSSKP